MVLEGKPAFYISVPTCATTSPPLHVFCVYGELHCKDVFNDSFTSFKYSLNILNGS